MHFCLMFGALQRALLGSQTACETPNIYNSSSVRQDTGIQRHMCALQSER
jgi:hypothetical protein